MKVGARTTWAALLGLGFLYELYTLFNRRKEDTLSDLVARGTKVSPLLPFGVGVVIGHWFWPGPGSRDGKEEA